MYRKILIVILLVIAGYHYFVNRPVSVDDGVLVVESPKQFNSSARGIQHKEFQLIPQATFDITARVLSKQNYHIDTESKLVKTDLALGWGRMSDSRVIKQLNISQSGRFYRWRYRGAPPIPTAEIISSSANMHLIASDDHIQDTLDNIRPNQIVHLTGKLVNARSDNFMWNTSTTRTDTGAGACELFYVETVFIK